MKLADDAAGYDWLVEYIYRLSQIGVPADSIPADSQHVMHLKRALRVVGEGIQDSINHTLVREGIKSAECLVSSVRS